VDKHPFPTRVYVGFMGKDLILNLPGFFTVNKPAVVRFLRIKMLLRVFPDPVWADGMWNTLKACSSVKNSLWRICSYPWTIKNIPDIVFRNTCLST
jgi:hypothetical protein